MLRNVLRALLTFYRHQVSDKLTNKTTKHQLFLTCVLYSIAFELAKTEMDTGHFFGPGSDPTHKR